MPKVASSFVPPMAAVGLTAIVSIIIPGRVAIALPLLLISPLLVVVLVLLRGPGLLLLEVLLGPLIVALPGCRFAADVNRDCANRNPASHS